MPTIGEILREARTKKGISEAAAAKVLRIKVDRVTDLEQDRYDQFPAEIYARGFLRQYSNYLGIDSDQIVQRFSEEHPPSLLKPVFEIPQDPRSNSTIQRHVPIQAPSFFLTPTGKAVLMGTLLVLIILGVFVWWIARTQLPHINQPAANVSPFASPFEPPSSSALDPWKIAVPEIPPVSVPAQALTLGTNSSSLESHRHTP